MPKRYYSLVLIALLLFPVDVFAQHVAELYSLEGVVEARIHPEEEWKPALKGTKFKPLDVIRTKEHSRAGVVFNDGVLVRLIQNSTLGFKEPVVDSGTSPLSLLSGVTHFFSREPKKLPVIETQAVSASVRGTEFVVEVAGPKTIVSVIDGVVELTNSTGTATLGKGEQGTTVVGKAPVKSIMLSPLDAVQWALPYPAVLSLADFADYLPGATESQRAGFEALKRGDIQLARQSFSGSSWRDVQGRSLALYLDGDTRGALIELDKYSGDGSAGFHLYRSSLSLAAGEVESASSALSKVDTLIKHAPAESRSALTSAADSIRSVLALSKNSKEDAYAAAVKARDANPASPAAGLALAFSEQARFNMDGAYAALEEALKHNPNSPFLLARLAELELGFGRSREAEAHLSEALRIAPEHHYVLTVMGFLKLVQDKAEEAQRYFERSSAKDQGDALAYMGLGLAHIRQGHLDVGRGLLQQAVHLAPNVSVYRSYLGKAFFEEEREHLSEKEYGEAIALDALDPTPYLYRAFTHLSLNRPVQALNDVEKSIDLNNSRAVYRSSFLLDQDLGVRSAGLAEVFNSLGFSSVARVEAIKSISRDYTNYSAHRLLGDSYNTEFTEYAQNTETALSKLLAPLSLNLFRSGNNQASLNEYSSLFDYDESRTGVDTEFQTEEDELIVKAYRAGKEKQLGYYFDYQLLDAEYTDGNHDLGDQQVSGILQYQVTPYDRLFLDTIFLKTSRERSPTLSLFRTEAIDATLGYVHEFTPNLQFLFQTSYRRDHNKSSGATTYPATLNIVNFGESVPIPDLEIFTEGQVRDKLNQSRTSTQFVYDSDTFGAVLGSEIFFADTLRNEDGEIIDDNGALFTDLGRDLFTSADNDLDTQSTYLYSTWHLASWLDIDLGVSYTDVELEQRSETPLLDGTYNHARWNPKVGSIVYLSPETTWRTAYFEDAVRKSFLEDLLTLEPGLVGGINQRFSDLSSVRSRNYGTGLDHKFSGSTYLGVEWIHRDLTEDQTLAFNSFELDFDEMRVDSGVGFDGVEDVHQDIDLIKTYIYQVISDSFVGTVDYGYSLFEDTDPQTYRRVEAHTTEFVLRNFHTSGLFSFIKGTWYKQDREGLSLTTPAGESDFWLFDAGLGYRIPHRHGVLSLALTNIFDRDFTYEDVYGFNEFIYNDLTVKLLASVNF